MVFIPFDCFIIFFDKNKLINEGKEEKGEISNWFLHAIAHRLLLMRR
jgi:hypothetical protein